MVIDASREQSVIEAAKAMELKICSLDVLVNNAGILGNVPSTPSLVSDDAIKQVFETNFFGVIRTIRAFMPMLKKSAAPRIVNVTSDLASLTSHNDPDWEYYKFKDAAYGPSKTALNAYKVALDYELRDLPFKVNAVNPGYTTTDFNNHPGTKTMAEAAKIIVEYAMLGADGPTGTFTSDYGLSAW